MIVAHTWFCASVIQQSGEGLAELVALSQLFVLLLKLSFISFFHGHPVPQKPGYTSEAWNRVSTSLF